MFETQEIGYLIFAGMSFALLLGIGIVFLSNKNQRIQELSEKLIKETEEKKELEKLEVAITTQEKERSEIARLLHDDLRDPDVVGIAGAVVPGEGTWVVGMPVE